MDAASDINRIMIRKYLGKYYKIYKIYLMNRDKPINVKNPLKFEIYDVQQCKEVNVYLVSQLVTKIFSVNNIFVEKIISELALEEFDKYQEQQLEIDSFIQERRERNNSKIFR